MPTASGVPPVVSRTVLLRLLGGLSSSPSYLLEAIAESTAFTGTDSSNATQVRRIIRDARITLTDVYYPRRSPVQSSWRGS
jgi:hypothetical protein